MGKLLNCVEPQLPCLENVAIKSGASKVTFGSVQCIVFLFVCLLVLVCMCVREKSEGREEGEREAVRGGGDAPLEVRKGVFDLLE